MMTGASLAHATLTMNVAFALRQALRGTGYRRVANDAKVVASDAVSLDVIYEDTALGATRLRAGERQIPAE